MTDHEKAHDTDDPNEEIRREEELVAPEEKSDWLPEPEPTDHEAPAP